MTTLATSEQILEHGDDISFCENELVNYLKAQETTQIVTESFKSGGKVSLLEDAYKVSLIEGDAKRALGMMIMRTSQMSRRDRDTFMREVVSIVNTFDAQIFNDPDEKDFFRSFKGTDLPLVLILEESIRIRQAKIDLMKIQIDWLKEQERKEGQRSGEFGVGELQRKGSSVETSVSQPPDLEDGGQFSLVGWNLYWTTRMWSSNPNHLVRIPTDSKSNTVKSVEHVARGEISVRAASIVRAIEFHLQKDVIQKALATRNKYGPENVREWIKLKRGRDRILVLIPDANQQEAIFFAAGRDVIYRSL